MNHVEKRNSVSLLLTVIELGQYLLIVPAFETALPFQFHTRFRNAVGFAGFWVPTLSPFLNVALKARLVR